MDLLASKRSRENCRLGAFSLGVRLDPLTWELSFVIFAWEPSLANFQLGSVAGYLSSDNFRLGNIPWKVSSVGFRLGLSVWELWLSSSISNLGNWAPAMGEPPFGNWENTGGPALVTWSLGIE